jgi:hypothetical protein
MNLEPLPRSFAATVAALHHVAEDVVAPARKPDNEIALTATPGGFGTPAFEWEGTTQQVRVEGTDLVFAKGDAERREPLDVDPVAAARLADWYAFGAEVLGELGGAATLWPEHFDIAIDLGEATYGLSPGDEQHPEPYAYVAPWGAAEGELWQATGFRGAELPYADLLAAPDARAAALDFFTTRKEALA